MTSPIAHHPAAGERPPRIAYQPALDGVRAVAVAMVIAFHLELPGAQGGYLGVSVFFTLSGFLITRLLLIELATEGRIDVGRYLGRRARRLLPPSLLGLGMVIALAAAGVFGPSRDLRRSIWAALAQVFNWFELGSGDSYADLFVTPSPVAHFWSLAIEEQFYWLWPPALIGLAALVRRRRRDRAGAERAMAGAIAVAFLLAALSAPLTAWWWSSAAAYLATWTRAAEILAGAVVAALVTAGHRVERAAPTALPVGLLIGVAVLLTPAGRGWAYAGWLPVLGIASAVLIAGLQGPSPARRALSWGPLVAIGKVSYGLYVYHWPVILWLTPDRTGTSGWPLAAVRVALTAALTVASYLLVEQPIRRGRRRVGRAVAPAAVIGGAVVAGAAALWVPVPAAPLPPAPVVLAAPTSVATGATTPPTTGPPIGPTTTDREPAVTETTAVASGATAPVVTVDAVGEPLVLAVLGDSVPAWLLRDAAPDYDRTDVVIVNGAYEACDGAIDPPPGRDRHGNPMAIPQDCDEWPVSYPATFAEAPRRPDAALLVLGQLPVVDREVDGAWRHPCDGIGWYLADVDRRIGWLRERGIEVVFALPARPGRGATFIVPDDVGRRHDCIRADLRRLLVEREVAIVDLDARLCPPERCDETRIDGIHVFPDQASAVLDWLLDEVLDRLGR